MTSNSDHRQSKEWTGNAGKIANVADATFVIRPDTLYSGRITDVISALACVSGPFL